MPRKAPYGVLRGHLPVYVPIPTGTGAAEIVTDLAAGFEYKVEKVTAYVAIVGAGGGATRTLRVLKGASTVVATGTVTLAGTATLGAAVALTVTDANALFDDDDTLTVDFASGGTAFTGGALNLVVQYRQQAQRVA
jgi:hypothetical protein